MENGQDWPDNAQRFGLFSKVAALLADKRIAACLASPMCCIATTGKQLLAPAYLHFSPSTVPQSGDHSLIWRSQGNFAPATVANVYSCRLSCFKRRGRGNFTVTCRFFKGGSILLPITSPPVSPNYAPGKSSKLIWDFGMQGLLRRAAVIILSGILNGD